MLWRTPSKVRPAAGFIEPCIPTVSERPPTGPHWVYEIKHDGYRLIVRKSGDRVRVYTRRGADWTLRYPLIVEGARSLMADSALLDGECVVCGADGLADFGRLHARTHDSEAILYAFDLLEIDGADLRRLPLAERKARLQRLLRRKYHAIRLNDHIAGDGAAVWKGSWRSALTCLIGRGNPSHGSK